MRLPSESVFQFSAICWPCASYQVCSAERCPQPPVVRQAVSIKPASSVTVIPLDIRTASASDGANNDHANSDQERSYHDTDRRVPLGEFLLDLEFRRDPLEDLEAESEQRDAEQAEHGGREKRHLERVRGPTFGEQYGHGDTLEVQNGEGK